MEAFENLLLTWILLMKSEDALFLVELKEQSLIKIFNAYVPRHLSPSDGDRTSSEKKEFISKEISSSFYVTIGKIRIFSRSYPELKNKKFLYYVGKFERRILNYSLPELHQQITHRTENLKTELNRLSQETENLEKFLSNLSLSGQSVQIENIFEDLHWLVIFTGHLICKESNVGIIASAHVRYVNMKQVICFDTKLIEKYFQIYFVAVFVKISNFFTVCGRSS